MNEIHRRGNSSLSLAPPQMVDAVDGSARQYLPHFLATCQKNDILWLTMSEALFRVEWHPTRGLKPFLP